MAILRQILYTGIVCYVCMSMGLTFAWPSCTIRLFASNETVLHRPMTETEISLFGSLSSIGAVISNPIMGYLLDIVGRKYSAMIAIMTHVICWLMVATNSQVEVIIAAMFVSGLGASALLCIPVYVSEICQENIRGAMTAGSMISYSIGMLISYVLGSLLAYQTLIYFCLAMAAFGVMLLTMSKESPMFLMMKGKEDEAAKAIAFYRNMEVNSKEVTNEMDTLRRAFNAPMDEDSESEEENGHSINTSPEEQKLNPQEKPPMFELKPPKEKLSLWKFICKSRSTRQAMFVTMTLSTASMFQGLVVLQVYAEPLFAEAVPNMPTVVSLVIFSLVAIVSGFITAYLTEVFGRRNLMIYFSAASSLCCVILGSQLHIHWAPHWVTAVFIYVFTACFTFGAGTVPYILVAEVFLPEVKSLMSMMVMEWSFLCSFVILLIFNPLVTAIGLGPTFYIFATVCILTSIFSFLYQPETKGLAVDEIQTVFAKRR